MFGVAVARLEPLSEAEKQRYQAFYCGLCRELKQRYGQLSRVVLSYDLTFLVIFLDSLSEPPQSEGADRCIAHPRRKMPFIQSVNTAYAADLSVALAYHKVLDDVADDATVRAHAAELALRASYEKAQARIPEECAALEACMAQIRQLEANPETPPDACAHVFGRVMGELFAAGARRSTMVASAQGTLPQGASDTQEAGDAREVGASQGVRGAQETQSAKDAWNAHEVQNAPQASSAQSAQEAWGAQWAQPCGAFGNALGRLIYLMDAAVDLSADRRAGSYNPFVALDMDVPRMRQVLTVVAADAADAFERLPLVQDAQLMRAVLYAGIWQKFNHVYEERACEGHPQEERLCEGHLSEERSREGHSHET